MSGAELEVILEGIDFAEGPRWHDGHLWFSDFYQGTVSRIDDAGNREVMLSMDGQPSGLGWMPNGDLLLVSMLDRKVMRYDGQNLTEHADLSSIATFHCNDMIVDPKGRAYVGNFGFDLMNEGLEGFTPADLAMIDPDGTPSVAATELGFPNGMVFTDNGKTLVVAESFGSDFKAFDVSADGTLSNSRVWAAMPGTAPDGCDIDAEGGIWFADALGSRVMRVVEGGEVTDEIAVGTGAFACALGGADGKTLYILAAPSSNEHEIAGKASGSIMTAQVAVSRAI